MRASSLWTICSARRSRRRPRRRSSCRARSGDRGRSARSARRRASRRSSSRSAAKRAARSAGRRAVEECGDRARDRVDVALGHGDPEPFALDPLGEVVAAAQAPWAAPPTGSRGRASGTRTAPRCRSGAGSRRRRLRAVRSAARHTGPSRRRTRRGPRGRARGRARACARPAPSRRCRDSGWRTPRKTPLMSGRRRAQPVQRLEQRDRVEPVPEAAGPEHDLVVAADARDDALDRRRACGAAARPRCRRGRRRGASRSSRSSA